MVGEAATSPASFPLVDIHLNPYQGLKRTMDC